MPDPSTPRISLYKSKSDGSELVSYTADLAQNWDKVDLAVGFQAATFSTRPSTPYSGKSIFQTDTANSSYFHNGSSPASGGWVEIPNSSAVYQGRLVTLFPGSTSATSLVRLAQTGAASGSRALATRGSGDTVDHFQVDFDGRMQWGPGGSTTVDVNLYRSAANTLATDDSLAVGINLAVTGDLTVQGKAQGRGCLSSLSVTANVSLTTSEASIAQLPSATYVNGRAYRVTVWGRLVGNTAGQFSLFRLRKGAGTAGAAYIDAIREIVAATSSGQAVSYVFFMRNTSGADVTTAVTWTGVTSGSSTGTWIGDTISAMSGITIEDVGLATDWPGSPIT